MCISALPQSGFLATRARLFPAEITFALWCKRQIFRPQKSNYTSIIEFFCQNICTFEKFVVILQREMNEGTRKGSLARVKLWIKINCKT